MKITHTLLKITYVTGIHVLGMLVSFLTVPLLIDTLGLEAFGYYIYWLSIFTLSGMLIGFGVENVQLHKLAVANEKFGEIVVEAVTIRIAPFLITITLFSILMISFKNFDAVMFKIYIVYALSVLFNLNWVQYALENSMTASLIEFLSKILFLLLFIFFADSYVHALWLFAIVQLSTTIVFLILWLKLKPKNLLTKFITAPKFESGNLNVIIAGLFSLPLNQLIPIVTMSVFGPIFVAHFGVMEKVSSAIKSLYSPISKVATPLITRHIQNKLDWKLVIAIGIAFFASSLLLTIFLLVFAVEILSIISKDKFSGEYLEFFYLYIVSIPLVVLISYVGANILLGLKQYASYRNSSAAGAFFFLVILVTVYFSKSATIFFVGVVTADLIILISMIISLGVFHYRDTIEREIKNSIF